MRFICYTLIGILLFCSCNKQNTAPNPPSPPTPLPVDTTSVDTTVTLNQQNWVLTAYRLGEFGPIINRSDTICFLSNSTYTYNAWPSTYSFYPIMSAYNLTLNETFIGNISGSIYTFNLLSGQVDGNKFTNITTGGSELEYYLWLHRI
jgi:hypothetical protein